MGQNDHIGVSYNFLADASLPLTQGALLHLMVSPGSDLCYSVGFPNPC